MVSPPPVWIETSFGAIAGWEDDDHVAAYLAFGAGGRPDVPPPKVRGLGVNARSLYRLARLAWQHRLADQEAARRFFERHFAPRQITAGGFVTGYYEPELAASLFETERFNAPLYRGPPELIDVTDLNRPAGWDPEVRFGCYVGGGLHPYFDRAAIEEGALRGRGLELAWLENPVDAFFVHVQGSARLRLGDGTTMRVGYAGKSGHAYTSIGKLAVQKGLLALDDAHKDGLEAWLKAHPSEGRALMNENRSFIFFRETAIADADGPLGAAGVPLTAGRSLAVDRTLHTFGTPIWVDSPGLDDLDRPGRFRRLMVAQDTGSAIVGAARGDLFIGSGEAAGHVAGRVRHGATMTVLLPVASDQPE